MRKQFIYMTVALAVLASCSVKESEPETAALPLEEETAPQPKIVDGCFAGQAVVEFDDEMIALIESDLEAGLVETKSPALNAVLADLGIASLERVFPDAGEFEARSRAAGPRERRDRRAGPLSAGPARDGSASPHAGRQLRRTRPADRSRQRR